MSIDTMSVLSANPQAKYDQLTSICLAIEVPLFSLKKKINNRNYIFFPLKVTATNNFK